MFANSATVNMKAVAAVAVAVMKCTSPLSKLWNFKRAFSSVEQRKYFPSPPLVLLLLLLVVVISTY